MGSEGGDGALSAAAAAIEWGLVEKYFEELNPGKKFEALHVREKHEWRAAYRLKPWKIGDQHECGSADGPHVAGPVCVRYAVAHGDQTYEPRAAWTIDDPVHHPSHYTDHPSGVECLTITEHMSFLRGNAMKYLWRAGKKKDAIVDLEKAVFYIQREIQNLKDEWESRDRTGES